MNSCICNDMSIIRSVTPADINEWLRMRNALWPDGSPAQHRQDIDRYFAGDRREPAGSAVSAENQYGAVLGFAELSIRNIVDSCTTDRVAYLPEGWYVVPESRRKGIRSSAHSGCGTVGYKSKLHGVRIGFQNIDNDVSHAAHLRSGFEETGRVRTFRKKLRNPP